MTKKEFLMKVKDVEGIDEEVKNFAEAELEKMANSAAARKEKRTNTPSRARLENEEFLNRLIEMNVIRDEPKTATDIAGIFEVKTQKATQFLKLGVEKGIFEQVEMKITGKKVKAYRKANCEDENVEG